MPELHQTTLGNNGQNDSSRMNGDGNVNGRANSNLSPNTRSSDLTMIDTSKGVTTHGSGSGKGYPMVEHNPNMRYSGEGMRARPVGSAAV